MRGIKPEAAVIAEAMRSYEHEPRVTVEEIAWRAGVNRKTVRDWARAAGLTSRPPARERLYSEEDDALAVRLYLQEPRLSMRQIEAKTGMSDSKIRDAVAAAGHPVRTKGRPKHDHAEVVRLDAEHGPNAAARLLGCSPGTVHYHREVERRMKVRAELRAEEQKRKRRRAA